MAVRNSNKRPVAIRLQAGQKAPAGYVAIPILRLRRHPRDIAADALYEARLRREQPSS